MSLIHPPFHGGLPLVDSRWFPVLFALHRHPLRSSLLLPLPPAIGHLVLDDLERLVEFPHPCFLQLSEVRLAGVLVVWPVCPLTVLGAVVRVPALTTEAELLPLGA